ncbi:MAG: hypothetical protein HXY38_03140 [Chloroflexi bacterium]|nr:hypothetical protein [Chloroflexota bacterium]
MENEDPFEVRVGTFFVVMGAGAFVLFVISDFSNQVDFDFFFVALVLMGIGFYIRRKKAPPPPSGRFAWFKGFWARIRSGKKGGGNAKDNKDKK